MTYRERREAKAERLREWAEKRAEKAQQASADARRAVDGIPFGQPILIGHHSQRHHERALERQDNKPQQAHEHDQKSRSMASRSANITAQADRAIYSDDPDAIEQLEARIAELVAERDRVKRYNATARKGEPDASILSEGERRGLMSMARAGQVRDDLTIPKYHLANLSGNINRQKKRPDALRDAAADVHPKPLRVVQARRDGECERCGEAIESGQWIGKYADGWSHVTGTDTWARCEAAEGATA